MKYLANGWRTSGLVRFRSGDVLTPYLTPDNSLTGLSQDRPNLVAGTPVYSKNANNVGKCAAGARCVNYLNSNAYAIPANTGPGTGFGNVGKATIRGPRYTDWDAAIVRAFPVHEEMAFEFRAEYFNLLNKTNLGNPNTAVTNAAFGTVTSEYPSTDPQRIAQFSLKFVY